MPFQRAPTQVLAALAVGEAAGIVVVLQVRLLRHELRAMGGLHLQRGLLEVVVAPGNPAGTGVEAHAEALDHRLVGDQPGVLHVGDGALQPRKGGLVVAEDQHMALGRKLMVVMDAFLLAEPAEERQVGFVVLRAVFAGRVRRRAQLEAVGVGENAVALQHPADDFRHAEALEDALVAAQPQVGQARLQGRAIAGQALAGVPLGDAGELSVDPLPARREDQEGRLVQQRVEVQIGSLADQLQVEAKGLADGFATAEGEDLEVVPEVFDAKAEVRLVGGGEHSLSSWKRSRAFLAYSVPGATRLRPRDGNAGREDRGEQLCNSLRTRPPGRINADLNKFVTENFQNADTDAPPHPRHSRPPGRARRPPPRAPQA